MGGVVSGLANGLSNRHHITYSHSMTINPNGNIYIMCFDIKVVLKVYKSACE